ncbi:hypothetical protein K7432_012414 [Basidiobolus ranarum]|uniref:F-box domain-containing protein n=1 Tax=Basidiobolus ranarum TaxID=34480 RepID=A0ABR2WKT8_9FUNG
MISQLALSEELIALIISHLAREKHALHSLLTVNKLFFNTVTPVLYRNPFRACFWGNLSETKNREILYLLLASANLLPELTNSTTKILKWDFTEWEPPTAPFTVNYLDYYTEVNFSEWKGVIHTQPFSSVLSDVSFGFGQIINHLFCKYNAEKIRSVCFPILNMKPYLSIASRFSSLRKIEFYRVHEDILFTNDQNIVTIQDAIEFVKIHVSSFGGTLTGIKIPDFTDLECHGIQSEVLIEDIINVLKRPEVIEVNDSYQFCQYLESPGIDHIRVFKGPFICYSGRIRDWDSASLLQRCPKLEKVRFSLSRANSFKWAVERRAVLLGSGSKSNSILDSQLAPLQDVDIMCRHCTALPIVQDIVYAFRDTIKNINVIDTLLTGLIPGTLCWDWLLPNLVKIRISEADFSLFDMGSLNLCPSLEELYLIGEYEYRSSSTVAEFGPILRLPKLRKIQLEYGISYRYNLASLEHSPLLESLILLEKGSPLPIRPADSPCWTWTWNWSLRHLREMYLTGESAALFQFHLLDSCPPLEYLSLSIEGYHQLLSLDEMTEDYLILPPRPMNQEGSRNASIFWLYGKWDLSKEMLSYLLQRYMPHVTEIHLNDIEGLTALDVVTATQKMEHIQCVYSTLCLTDTDIKQSGMHLKECIPHSREARCVSMIGSVNYHMAHTSD